MSLLLGQAGEHLTAAILLEMKITVAICPTEGFDLIAFDKSAHYRVECKTTGAVYRHSKKKVYRFGTNRGTKGKVALDAKDCDIVALVALPVRRVIFRNITTIKTTNTRLPIDLFEEGCERPTWESAIRCR